MKRRAFTVLLLLLALQAVLAAESQVGASAIQYVSAIYWSGLPMLVPLLHLVVLRLSARANKPMHATREDTRA